MRSGRIPWVFRSDFARELSQRVSSPASLDEARAVVARYVEHYNGVRLHSAIGYITPNDFLAGRSTAIWAERDRKLEAARELRRVRRQAAREVAA